MFSLFWSFLLVATSAVPASFDPGAHKTLFAAHGEGAQIYECRVGAGGVLAWAFREPIASLIVDGKTVGRHYAGPYWALADGSLLEGKVTATIPGATPTDIPQLKLAVVARHGKGALAQATLVYRIRTHGGTLAGPCGTAGTLRSVGYSADYLFEK
ncbi:DUF3455 domain-containing protein [Sphingomonas sp. PAMC 26605]|uniref:DUF3455 domain-containing protein n=1 Tax=Sphingomonas sp. PAMC 26605 TaxID=1112214 RepID=UPI00026CAC25|nr:DUF3455 domain-containing protein [Sphingomonas sp. PAMC 26605]